MSYATYMTYITLLTYVTCMTSINHNYISCVGYKNKHFMKP